MQPAAEPKTFRRDRLGAIDEKRPPRKSSVAAPGRRTMWAGTVWAIAGTIAPALVTPVQFPDKAQGVRPPGEAENRARVAAQHEKARIREGGDV